MSEATSHERVAEVLEATLAYSRAEGYAGYNKHDGLNSPILAPILGWAKWPRLAGTQLVMRFPWNLRPALRVPKTRNAKGQGLFASAYLDLWERRARSEDLDRAIERLDWLLEHPAAGFPGMSWGYPYPWQDVGFYAPKLFPNRVVTCWIGFALVAAARATGEQRYLDALPRIAEFLTTTPNVLEDNSRMKCYSYVPDPRVTWAVMDVPALVGAFLAEAAGIVDLQAASEATRLLNWVADKQTDYGAWHYTHPPGDSHIVHDNYHSAIILDCFDRYREATGDDRFDEVYRQGLRFYSDELVSAEGAPRWMSDREHPYDIHGAASGILCLARAGRRFPGYRELAERMVSWTLRHMYDPRGYFYYQKRPGGTRRFLLMRWANAWMSHALAYYLRATGGSVVNTQ
ncbi:MAG: hypothetical protein ACE5GX_01180 [Thermoanaerobaculia bacterium]